MDRFKAILYMLLWPIVFVFVIAVVTITESRFAIKYHWPIWKADFLRTFDNIFRGWQ
jgi:hypothetical protein